MSWMQAPGRKQTSLERLSVWQTGVSVLFREEFSIANTFCDFFCAVVDWANFECLTFLRSLPLLSLLSAALNIISVVQGHFRDKGDTPPPAPSRDKGLVSFVFWLIQACQFKDRSLFTFPLPGLQAGLLLGPCQRIIPFINLLFGFLDAMLPSRATGL